MFSVIDIFYLEDGRTILIVAPKEKDATTKSVLNRYQGSAMMFFEGELVDIFDVYTELLFRDPAPTHDDHRAFGTWHTIVATREQIKSSIEKNQCYLKMEIK